MKCRQMGSLSVSEVGLGCNNFGRRLDAESATRVIEAAIDAGITLFDTADTYGETLSEVILGKALRPFRSECVIATKFGMGDGESLPSGASAASVVAAAEGSLRRLGTDWIDLFQIHQPDNAVPVDETVEALQRLIDAGKVREIGCSNFNANQTAEIVQAAAGDHCRVPIALQNELSLLHREEEVDITISCESNGLHLLPFFPLASGMLSGKYSRGSVLPQGTRIAGYPEELRARFVSSGLFDTVEMLAEFCEKRGRPLLSLAFSWLLSKPFVASVIAGASSPEQVKLNVSSVGWRLSSDELLEIDKMTLPGSSSIQFPS
jgi:aryl-alcohol dehydrogenase-like predicted oxidoreductase